MLLCQTKYFKKLLEQTYNMRKESSKLKDSDFNISLAINSENVEKKMYEI